MPTVLKILKLDHANDIELPSYGLEGNSGMDLRAAVSAPVVINPSERALIPTGIRIFFPFGYEGQIRSRSGMAASNGVVVLNSPGTIDSCYQGEIKVILINLSDKSFVIDRGMRIAQLVVARVETCDIIEVNELEIPNKTDRSDNGFGSTGML
ncbi:deoxyuridine 5'-triphosphate nucleotidohydrolase [Candidatus Hydrogenosomobacter endosymbioticus]|uniref:Deoxyuridine 5'-triphosphate nucleotidohydrolase n=2 Tax=Candidatus Hydrogenosomobacter endosymbioticus TaxID=2558174 RepID=A0ABM7V9B7_9PROT|nr:dUTP diphosphatase [Candidatus Hydrogenosomobacter endosymbioticus]BDB96366.1 deoxyuridine 5'-triphosphate nucleotidohydrolase [Candidatus Hydrogenosomobacter endosymbioticus]